MNKYFFSLSLVFLVSFPISAAKAENASGVVPNGTQKNDAISITLAVDQYSETIAKDTLDSWIVSKNSFSLSPNTKAEFENTDCFGASAYSLVFTNKHK